MAYVLFDVIPGPIQRLAQNLPAFSIGRFGVSDLMTTLGIYLFILIFFGLEFWISALTAAAQLAIIIFLSCIAVYSAFGILTSIFRYGIDVSNVIFERFIVLPGGEPTPFTAATLEQPIFLAVVLPSALAFLFAIERFFVTFEMEKRLLVGLRRPGESLRLVSMSFLIFVRCFNHVAHFVIPNVTQILREDGFYGEMSGRIRAAVKHIYLPESFVLDIKLILERLAKVGCGVIMLSAEYIPMWLSQVVQLIPDGDES